MSQGIAPFDRLTKLTSVLNAEELIKHWTGLTEQQIANFVGDGSLKAYIIKETRLNNEGLSIHYCKINPITPMLIVKNNKEKFYSYGDAVFSKDEVEDIDRQHPDFTYQLEGPRGIPLTPAEVDGTAFNQIPCYILAKRWGCSKEDVLFIIKTGGFNFPCSDEDSESIDFVYDAIVFEEDLIEWEKSHKVILDYLKGHFSKHALNKSTIQELRSTAANKSKVTIPADLAHKESSLENWKQDVARATKLAFRLPINTTRSDKINFHKIWDDELRSNNNEDKRQEAFNIFRKTVLQEMKDNS